MTRCVAGSDLETVALSALDERLARYRLQNRQAEQLMALSLQRYGQLSPIVVCAEPEDRWLLIDGFKRLRCVPSIEGAGAIAGAAH
jgi:ParB-like chromosome segregation protein Spo0J